MGRLGWGVNEGMQGLIENKEINVHTAWLKAAQAEYEVLFPPGQKGRGVEMFGNRDIVQAK